MGSAPKSCLVVAVLAAVVLSLPARRAEAQADPGMSNVEPWDTYGHAFVSPGRNCDLTDLVTITVRNSGGSPLVGIPVEIDFSACSSLCVDPVNSGLSGTTDGDGQVVLDPAVGGCESCQVIVRAGSQTLRTFTEVVSTDVDGDGLKNINDYIWISNNQGAPCTDFNGNGQWDNSDIILLVGTIDCGNGGGCAALQVPTLSEWGRVILLSLLLVLGGILALRQDRRRSDLVKS